eukprot:TRINITY_DN4913_c0_g2_i2.p1 TRINITY_DN4913_c0_g2~~TRINITY_DN4913_c0_g2_i2.p1  ORF type:complete len:108 (+),score=7.77 TRINITY_DN4913_c0_g2_i2:84-407(+)
MHKKKYKDHPNFSNSPTSKECRAFNEERQRHKTKVYGPSQTSNSPTTTDCRDFHEERDRDTQDVCEDTVNPTPPSYLTRASPMKGLILPCCPPTCSRSCELETDTEM